VRSVIRALGFMVLAASAVAVFFVLAPTTPTELPSLPSATRYESLITDILAADDANNLRTEGAPQQQVVNGWTARDLLTIIAKQNVDLLAAQGAVVAANGNLMTTPFDERLPALLLIGVLAICWTGVSASRGNPVVPAGPTPAAAAPVIPEVEATA